MRNERLRETPLRIFVWHPVARHPGSDLGSQSRPPLAHPLPLFSLNCFAPAGFTRPICSSTTIDFHVTKVQQYALFRWRIFLSSEARKPSTPGSNLIHDLTAVGNPRLTTTRYTTGSTGNELVIDIPYITVARNPAHLPAPYGIILSSLNATLIGVKQKDIPSQGQSQPSPLWCSSSNFIEYNTLGRMHDGKADGENMERVRW